MLEAELPNEQQVRLVLMDRNASSDQLPGMPEFVKSGAPDESGELQFEQEGDTAIEPEEQQREIPVPGIAPGRLRQGSRAARSRMPRHKTAARAAKKVPAKGRQARR